MNTEQSSSPAFRRFSRHAEFWVLLVITLASLPALRPLASVSTFWAAILALPLFVLPGSAVVCLLGNGGNWVERLVLAFVASLAVMGIPAQIIIFAHSNIGVYTWVFAILTIVLVVAAAIKNLLAPSDEQPQDKTDRTPIWLVAAIVALAAGLVFFHLNSFMDGDQFDNLGWIQGILHDSHIFVTDPHFAVSSVSPRFLFSAWFVQQAMMSFVSKVDPIDLVGPQQIPLILLSLAAMYFLARRVSGRRNVAAWITAAWIFYLLLWNQGGSFAGYEVIARSSLDKVVGSFVVLPVGIGLVLDYFNNPQRKTLLWLFFTAVAATLTHPIVGALFGLSLAGFAIIELALNRKWSTFWQVTIVAAILMVALTSSFYLVIFQIRHPSVELVATSLTDTRDPSLYLEISGAFNRERLLVLDNGSYILNPRLILQPVQILAFLTLPLLFLRMRKSHPERLLFGMLVLVTLLLIFPPTADMLGTLVTPSLLYRFHWLISIAAVITVGWLSWELLQKLPANRANLVGAASLVVLAMVGVPQLKWNFTWLHEYQVNLGINYCVLADPLLRPFQTLLTQNTVVLGDSDGTDFCLQAYAHNAKLVEYHGTNGVRTFIYINKTDEGWQRLFDAEYYHNAEFVDERLLSILKRWNVGYVIVSLDSPLEPQLRHLPGNFRPIFTAVDRRVYQVISTEPTSPVIRANSALTAGRWSDAITAYNDLLKQGDADTWYLAAIGLGRADLQTGKLDDAIAAWQQASAASAEAQPYALQGEAYALKHDLNSALHAHQQAVAQPHSNQTDQVRLGDMYQYLGQSDQAAKEYEAAAAQITTRGTSIYYSQLGQYWTQSGATDRALAAYEQANRIFESGQTYQQIGNLLESDKNWSGAEQAFQQMSRVDYWDWNAHTSLGDLYSALNEYSRASSEYLTSLRLHPLTIAPYQGLADVWSSQQGQPYAISQLEKLVGYRLGFGPAVSAMSTLQAESGNPTQAVADAQHAINWYRLGTSYYNDAAVGKFNSGDIAGATTYSQQALGLDSENQSAYLALAQIALQRADIASATGYTLRAVIAAPYSARPHVALANLYQQQGQRNLALAEYQVAAQRSIDKASGLTALGDYQLGQAQFAQATRSFQASLDYSPNSADALRGVGKIQQLQGQTVEATKTFSDSVRLQPGVGANRQALADILIQQGKTDEGVAQLKQATQQDIGYSLGYIDLGDNYLNLGRTSDAEKVYQQLIANMPISPEGYLALGHLYELQGDFNRASVTYQRAIARVPQSAAASIEIALADLQQKQGQYDQARASYQAAITRQPLLDAGYAALAKYYLGRGDVANAANTVKQGLGLAPGSAKLNEALAQVQVVQGNPADAEASYKKALAISPLDSSAAIALSELYASVGHPDAALAEINQVQQQRPGDTDILREQVKLDIALGQPDVALKAATRLTSIAGGKADSWIAHAQALAIQGQIDNALTAYQKATQLELGNPQAWLALGQFLSDQAKADQAKSALSQGIETNPGNVALHLAQAEILSRAGQPQDALKEYQVAAKLDTTQSAAWLALGHLDQQAGKLQAAQQEFNQAVAAAPTDPNGYQAQANSYTQQGLFDQAHQTLTKATQVAPGACLAHQNLADFLAARGDANNAESEYQRAMELSGCAASASIALGNLYLNQGKPSEAIVQFRQAIAANPGNAFAYAVLGNTLTMQLRWTESNAAFADGIAKSPASDLIYVAKGRSLIAQGKLQDGLGSLQKAAALHPGNAMDWVSVGDAAQVLNQFDVAENSYMKAADVDHSIPDPQIALGDLYARQARNDMAQTAYQNAIAIAPGEARTYNMLAAFLVSLNQNDQAISVFRQGVAADKGQIESLLYLGREFQRLGRVSNAQQAFQQAISIGGTGSTVNVGASEFQSGISSPSVAQAYIGLGNLRTSQADPAAIQDYQKAIELAPANPNGYINLGLAYLAQGKTNEAQTQFQKATEANPVSAGAYVALGALYQAQADQVAAQQAYLKAIGVSPANTIGYISLGRLYTTQGQQNAAVTQFQTASTSTLASAPVYIALGDLHRSMANWSAAEQAYLQAAKISPKDPRIYIGLGNTYEAQTQWNQAIAQFENATRLDPASADGYLALGALYRERADWKSAETIYQRATKVEPANPLGYIGLGQTFLVQGLTDQASAQFQAATQAAPASADAFSAQGDFYRLQTDWESAERSYQQAINVESTNPLGYIGLGLTYQAEGLKIQAAQHFQTAVKIAPSSGLAYNALGDWYQSQADWKDAESAYKQAIHLTPDMALAYVGLSHTYQSQGMTNDAVSQLQSGIDNAPFSAEPYIALGNMYTLETNWKSAQQIYQQAVTAIPTSSRARVALGDMYATQGDYADAAQAYKEAISVAPAGEWQTGAIEPPDLSAYTQLASLYETIGRTSDALQLLKTAIQAAPASGTAQTALGNWYAAQADYANAEKSYTQAIQNEPTNSSAYIALGSNYETQGRQSDALALYQSAVTANAGNADLLVALGDYQLARGNVITATQTYQQAVDLAPADVDARAALAKAYGWQGEFQQAEKTLNDSTALVKGSPTPYVALGDYYLGRQNWDASTFAYRQALTFAPADVLAHEGIVKSYLGQKQAQSAVNESQSWINIAPGGDPHPLLALGLSQRAAGDLDGSAATYQQVIEHWSGNIDGYLGLAQTLQAQGQFKQAASTLEQAMSVAPNVPEVYLEHGQTQEVLGDTDAALQDYRRAGILNASLGAPGLAQAKVMLAETDQADAIALLQQAVDAEPTNIDPYLVLNENYLLLHRNQDAVDLMTRAMQAVRASYLTPMLGPAAKVNTILLEANIPPALEARFALATDLTANSDMRGALKTLQDAMPIYPQNQALILGQIGQVYADTNDMTTAHKYYQQAEAVDPNQIASYLGEGLVYMNQQKEYTKAIDSFEQAAKTNERVVQTYELIMNAYEQERFGRPTLNVPCPYYPRVSLCNLRIGDITVHTGIDSQLESQYQALYDSNPNSIGNNIRMAAFYEAFSQFDQSIGYWQRVLKMDPANGAAYFQLGSLYARKETGRTQASINMGLSIALGPELQEAHNLLYSLNRDQLTDPKPGDVAMGIVQLHGTADSDQLGLKSGFSFYKVDVGAGSQPTVWTLVNLSHTPVANGVLGTWDTQALANGTYTLRLTAVDTSGNYGPWQEVTVQVQN